MKSKESGGAFSHLLVGTSE
jgi:hypothetical protein